MVFGGTKSHLNHWGFSKSATRKIENPNYYYLKHGFIFITYQEIYFVTTWRQKTKIQCQYSGATDRTFPACMRPWVRAPAHIKPGAVVSAVIPALEGETAGPKVQGHPGVHTVGSQSGLHETLSQKKKMYSEGSLVRISHCIRTAACLSAPPHSVSLCVHTPMCLSPVFTSMHT